MGFAKDLSEFGTDVSRHMLKTSESAIRDLSVERGEGDSSNKMDMSRWMEDVFITGWMGTYGGAWPGPVGGPNPVPVDPPDIPDPGWMF